jgi:hypothetical protein
VRQLHDLAGRTTVSPSTPVTTSVPSSTSIVTSSSTWWWSTGGAAKPGATV